MASSDAMPKPVGHIYCSVNDKLLSDESFEGLVAKINKRLAKALRRLPRRDFHHATSVHP